MVLDKTFVFISDDAIVGLDKIDFELSERKQYMSLQNNVIDGFIKTE
jgi:hypothetical protein